MALKRSGMSEKTDGTTELSLTMQAGESARIKMIRAYFTDVHAEDITVKINRKSILQIKVPARWYFLGPWLGSCCEPMVVSLDKAGLWPVIPLAEGETLTITGPGADDYLEVVYDLYDAGDVANTEPNGSKAKTYRMFQMISNSVAPTESGDEPLDQSDLDSQFPAFPGGAVVPANTQIHLLALFGAAASIGSGSANAQRTTHLKFLAEREELFDKALTGLLHIGDIDRTSASIQYYTDHGRLKLPGQVHGSEIIRFEEPIVFHAGQELNVLATILETTPANDMAVGDIKLGMIQDVLVA